MTGRGLAGSSQNEVNQSGTKGRGARQQPSSRHRAYSRLKWLWSKSRLDLATVLNMTKGALAPTIAIAIYQADGASSIFGTEGYVVTFATILAWPIFPRAKFIEATVLNIIIVSLSASINFLALWTAVQAREHTTPIGTPITDYNSAAAVICATWLFFEIYAVHSMISARPDTKFGGGLASIFAIISLTYGPSVATMDIAVASAVKLLITMLSGLAIAVGVSLLLPMTCRQVTFGQMTKYMRGMQKVLTAQEDYMHELETHNMFRTTDGSKEEPHREDSDLGGSSPPVSNVAHLRKSIDELRMLHSKSSAGLPLAKREIAFGRLSANDIGKIFELLRSVFLPLVGMSCLIRIFERVAERYGIGGTAKTEDTSGNIRNDNIEETMMKEWQAIMRAFHEPFCEIRKAMDGALSHVLWVLELEKMSPHNAASSNDAALPGHPGFAHSFETAIENFSQNRRNILFQWQEERSGSALYEEETCCPLWQGNDEDSVRHQRLLLITLYIEYLVIAASRALLNLVHFADHHVGKGTMEQKRLIFPGYKRVKKAFENIIMHPEEAHDSTTEESSSDQVHFGEGFYNSKDPEHLPPKTKVQRIGQRLRTIPRALRSPHSIYGFRVAVATIAIGLPAFLHNTHDFFLANRLYWALIMISVSMSRTAGQAFFMYFFRICATVLGVIVCFVIYYIVDGHTAGVIVMFFLAMLGLFYIVVRYPRFFVLGQVAAIAILIVTGYELEVAKIGKAAAEASGQLYYPLYILAPYRLATTVTGLFVAFLFTIFPYPISETSVLRSHLGRALYLTANHYAVVHETVRARYSRGISNALEENSPLYRLDKTRERMYCKLMGLIQQMKAELRFTTWQIPVGGEFPRDAYAKIIGCLENMVDYTALLGHASAALPREESGSESRWHEDLSQLFASAETTSGQIISILCLLSSSMLNSQPLPPHLRMPEPYELLSSLKGLDRDILKYEHASDPCYAAFAVIQVACRSMVSDLHALKALVEDLVGEFDFSVHAASLALPDAAV